MCYSKITVEEVGKLIPDNEWGSDIEHSYMYEECTFSIEEGEDFPISHKNPNPDNIKWFTDEVALKKARVFAIEMSKKHKDKVIVLLSGLQNCGGGPLELEMVELYDEDGNMVNHYEFSYTGKQSENNIGDNKLTDAMIEKIKSRQLIIEQEEKIREEEYQRQKQLRESFESKIQTFYEDNEKSLNRTENAYRNYSLDIKKKFLMGKDEFDKSSEEYIALEYGYKKGFNSALKFLYDKYGERFSDIL